MRWLVAVALWPTSESGLVFRFLCPQASWFGSLLRVWAPATSCEGVQYTLGTATL